MKRTWEQIILILLAALLCILPALTAAEEDYIVEEDGSKWYSDGRIEWADGTVSQRVDHDSGQQQDEDTSSSSGETAASQDGSPMIIDTGEEDPLAGIQVNEDGSITVESGQGGIDIEIEPTRAPLTEEEFAQRLEHAADLNGRETLTVYTDPKTGNRYAVEVRYMGIGRSMVVLNGKNTLVDTVNLQWATEAPEDKVLAVINTPGDGQAKMHAGKGAKTTVIGKCRLDKVVRVISTGKQWTLIDYEGMRGYVRTSSLEFFTNDHVEFDHAVLSFRGKTSGKNTINVRSRDETHRYLDSEHPFPVGTPITVFDIIDEWAEVDIGGWHCMINSAHLTLEEELISASN